MVKVDISPVPTPYQILQIPQPRNGSVFSSQDLRGAYHRALLLHHPDKSKHPSILLNGSKSGDPSKVYSIDQITEAYKLLADPVTRASYDSTSFRNNQKERWGDDKITHTGVEIYDLEDLIFDETLEIWYHGCRCGDEQGYLVNESDLERESKLGKIFVGCKGCSLWIRVTFASVNTIDPSEEGITIS